MHVYARVHASIYIYIYIYILMWTRALNARSNVGQSLVEQRLVDLSFARKLFLVNKTIEVVERSEASKWLPCGKYARF